MPVTWKSNRSQRICFPCSTSTLAGKWVLAVGKGLQSSVPGLSTGQLEWPHSLAWFPQSKRTKDPRRKLQDLS